MQNKNGYIVEFAPFSEDYYVKLARIGMIVARNLSKTYSVRNRLSRRLGICQQLMY